MTQVVIDAKLAERLRSAGSPVELRDPDGQLVGQLHRAERTVPSWVVLPLTDEELERRRHSAGPTYSTEEVLERLEKL
jgi:hypothetical protein